ncbi:hypothetical protein ASG48_01530 [Aurantimonas sp. Leaf443]|nr:hypothetical protein ASG48_01530 [Aurantimonas sp. Leaf443]
MNMRDLAMAGSALALLCATPALSADYGVLPPIYDAPIVEEAPELTPVEIGNGWYLRGDLGYAFGQDSVNRRTLLDGDGIFGVLDEDGTEDWSGGIGAGYRFTDWFRADATAEWLATADASFAGSVDCTNYRRVTVGTVQADEAFRSSCGIGEGSDLDIYNYMVNAYADLGTFVGLTPYVGAGIGVANVQSTYTGTLACNEGGDPNVGCALDSSVPIYGTAQTRTYADADDSTWQLSYSLMAGVGYAVSRNLTVDLGYRYLAVPEYDAFGATFDEGFDMHQVRAGLRYALW